MCPSPTAASVVPNAGGAPDNVPIYFSFLGCAGTEDNFTQCPSSGPGTFCRHTSDAYVACSGMYICVCVYVTMYTYALHTFTSAINVYTCYLSVNKGLLLVNKGLLLYYQVIVVI